MNIVERLFNSYNKNEMLGVKLPVQKLSLDS